MQTRIQVQTSVQGGARYSGIIGSLATIYREEGVRGWYHGFTPAVCSVAVFWTCYFPAYDYAKESIADASGLPQSSSLVHMAAAAGAGLLTDIVTNPLWVIRTRLATQRLRQHDPATAGGTGAGGTTPGGSGAPAGAVAGAAAPAAASSRSAVATAAATSSAASATVSSAAVSSSSAAASPAAAPAAAPTTAAPRQYLSMRHAFVTICAEEGWMALFSGLSASILGLSHIMIQFPLYERIKTELAARDPQQQHQQQQQQQQQRSYQQQRHRDPGHPPPPPQPPPSPLWHIIAASGMSKLVASTVTYPHEVVRARLQFDQGGRLYSGLIDVTRKTIQNDGIAGLWLGFNLNIVRTIPQCVVTFTLYEHFSRSLQRALGISAESPAQTQKHMARISRTRSEARA